MPTSETDNAPRYLPINRKQKVLQPLDVERLIEDGHPARQIWQVVERLELSRFEQGARAVQGHAGRSAHSPQLMIAVWIYAYSKSLHSAREIERQMSYEPGLQWLTAMRVVNHHTLSDFRVAHGEALKELLTQVLAMLAMKKLIVLERVAQDGTKIRADANRKSFSKAGKIRRWLREAKKHIAELEKQEAEEQASRRQQAARKRALEEQQQRLEEALEELAAMREAKKHDKQKEPQVSTTDRESRFMRTPEGGLAPAYNVQTVVDAEHGLIVDVEVVNDPQDGQQLAPAMERVKQRFDRYPRQALADGAYTNHESIVEMSERGIDYYSNWTGRDPAGRDGLNRHPDYHWTCFEFDGARNEFVCPQGKRLEWAGQRQRGKGRERLLYAAAAKDCRRCAARPDCCPASSLSKQGRLLSIDLPSPEVEAFDRKMKRPAAKQIYKQRAPLAEFPNAWIKTKLGLRRFHCRGLAKVSCEALWAVLTFNLQRMFRLAPA